MATQQSSMPATRLDATFRDPNPQDPSTWVFNIGANWIGDRVPDGTGTLASTERFEVTFSQPTTTLAAIKLTGGLSLELTAGQTLELTGDGLDCVSAGIAFSGTIVGNAVLKKPSTGLDSGYLSSTWARPAGIIKGAVTNEQGIVNPGKPNVSGSGTMTIDGHYIQGHPGQSRGAPGTLLIGVDANGLACLKVIGRADILTNSAVGFGVMAEQPIPFGREFPILTSTEGLRGVFARVDVYPEIFKVGLRYDDKTAYATVTHS